MKSSSRTEQSYAALETTDSEDELCEDELRMSISSCSAMGKAAKSSD